MIGSGLISQENYALAASMARKCMKKVVSDPKIAAMMNRCYPKTVGGEIDPKDWSLDHPQIKAFGRILMKRQYEELQKAGVATALGFNFFDLRGPAYFIFPLLTPLIQSIPKEGKVNAGVGIAANWKATKNPNSLNTYVGLQEGQRNAIATPDEFNYLATYKELGQEGLVTFTAQFAGEGYTDNMADEHFRNLARVRLGEEQMTLCGNAGPSSIASVTTGNLGYSLGTPTVAGSLSGTVIPTPTSTLATGTGALVTGSNVVVAVVAITPLGVNAGGQAGYNKPPTVANGLFTQFTRNNQDGTTTVVNCGVSAISNVAAIVTTNATAQFVNVSVPAIKGAVAYAWFWGVNVAAAAANVKLGAITSAPNYQITNVASGTQLGNATGLSNDNSYQNTDFDGLTTYALTQGLWVDMNGGSFTPQGAGQIAELENDLLYFWNNFQAQPNDIYVSGDVKPNLERAITFTSTGTNAFIFTKPAAEDATLIGGYVVGGYKSKYSINPSGSEVIPIRIHPMLPPGTLMYDISKNPYPHSRIPAVRNFKLQRDYYAIEWPVVGRQWTFGTYIHEVLAHYIPGLTAFRSGIGPFVAPCWIAAVVFGEDFFTGPRVQLVRKWLVNDWEKTGPLAKLVMALYRKHGKRAASIVEKSRVLKAMFRTLFEKALAKAEQKYGKA